MGTQFNVYARPNGTTKVSVLEGRVALRPRSDSDAAESLLLHAGEEAEIGRNGTMHQNAHALVANAVAWRQRRLVFNNELEDMVPIQSV